MADSAKAFDFDVAVIGGGFSGVSAARALQRHGCGVVLLEARDRLGGRAYSPELNGSRIDLGGQWVGAKQNRVLGLIDELGLGTHPQYRDGKNLLVTPSERRRFSRIIPPLKASENLEIAYHVLALDAASWLAGNPSTGAQTSIQQRFDGRSVEHYLETRVKRGNVRSLMRAAIEMILASDTDQISFLHFLRYLRAGGGFRRVAEVENGAQDLRIVGGAQQLVTRVGDQLGGAVRLGEPVAAIHTTARSVTVRTSAREYRVRRAVLALPPPLVDAIAFSPGLPPKRTQLNSQMKMGSVLKTVIGYEEPFWRDEGLSGEMIVPSGPIRGVFDNCNEGNHMASLVVFSIGREAKKLGQLAPEERKRVIVDGLAAVLGERARDVVAHADKDWNDDPYSAGCYAAVAPPKVLTACGDALRTPVGPLHFAGTETATKWCGFFDGAIEAGERAADEVLESLNGE